MEEQSSMTNTFLAMKEGAELPDEIVERVLPCMKELKRQMLELSPMELPNYIGAIFMLPTVGGVVRMLPRAVALQTVREMAAGLGRDEEPPTNILKSLETPVVGGLRVLVLTDDGYITLRLMTDDGAADFEANDREKLGYTYTTPMVPTTFQEDSDSESMSVGLSATSRATASVLKNFEEKQYASPGITTRQGVRKEIAQELTELLRPLSEKDRKKALTDVLRLMDSAAYQEMSRHVPGLYELLMAFEQRILKAHSPTTRDTAGNLEAAAMAAVYAWVPLLDKLDAVANPIYYTNASGTGVVMDDLMDDLSTSHPHIGRFFKRCEPFFSTEGFFAFCGAWMRANFARLEIGHKLAASLCFTDIPEDIEVVAPWPAWSLVVPDGLLSSLDLIVPVAGTGKSKTVRAEVARLWCIGSEMTHIIFANGYMMGMFHKGGNKDAETFAPLRLAIRNLVRGACLALSEPDDYKKKRVGNSASGTKSKRSGPPELEQAKYMLSAPITLDLRPQLLETLSGKTRTSSGGGKLTTQFMVRGHWKQQVHGKGRALRKRIRIAPFWKGDENARILLRNYTIKDEDTKE